MDDENQEKMLYTTRIQSFELNSIL
jgi:hypothetical protein